MEKLGMILTTLSAHASQSNGLVKSMNRTLLDKTRSMLDYGGLKERFRAEAFKYVAVLHNRTATPD